MGVTRSMNYAPPPPIKVYFAEGFHRYRTQGTPEERGGVEIGKDLWIVKYGCFHRSYLYG